MQLWNKIIPIIVLLNSLFAQSISTIDTIHVELNQNSLELKPLIIDSTLYLFHDGRFIDDYKINTITGELNLSKPVKEKGVYHASYKYLDVDIPLQIGPKFKLLPQLDSLLTIIQDSSKVEKISENNKIENDISNLATSGTIYRNISLSPLGGSDFGGGLQLQLQGQLSNDITVSGVLSDQSIPIQPEGTTQTLEEIDKVYLHVNHPIFQIMAGDIDYSLNNGKYLNLSRKLEGLKGELKAGKWSAKGTLASSKGRYHKLSIKGTDGSQGPYALTSETGNKDIIVLAGTEKVYLNGKLVKRGENFDYTIDYSTGEITFTPRRLIDFDTDIYIEYEYSEFQYTRNVVSSSINRELGKWGQVAFSWIKEKDQLQVDESIATGFRDSLKYSGDEDAIISGAIVDKDGDYLLFNGIYTYSPNSSYDDLKKYKVSFQNDNENGEYARKISNEGEIYFEYVEVVDRIEILDLYSPFTRWNNPVNHDMFQIAGNAELSKTSKVIWDVSISNLDKNTFSNIDDDDNVGLGYNLDLSGNEISLYKDIDFGYKILNWRSSKSFNQISKERDALFNREWNIDDNGNSQESLLSGGLSLSLNELFKSSAEWSQYQSILDTRERLTAKVSSSSKYIPIFSSYLNKVQTISSNFYQYDINTEMLPGNFHPIFGYKGEYEKGEHKFDVTKVGFLYNNKKQNISASVTRRHDFTPESNDSKKFKLIQDGIYGELDINGKLKDSWSGKIVFRKRISNNLLKNEKLDYSIGIANIRYQNKTKPIRWELLSKLEETYTESRAVVYDSVGTGLGSYRFNEEFNEYIADPNGAYISYTILTGERELNTHFNASQRFHIDFGKSKIGFLKNVDFRSDLNTVFKGDQFKFIKITDPELDDGGISSSKINIRNEIDINPTRSNRRIRNWAIYSHNLLGTDPRGNDLQTQTEYGVEWREPIKDDINSVINIDLHNFENSSKFSELRNRNVNGWWIEEEVKWKIDRKWQFSVSVLGGKDSGEHNEDVFKASAYGIKIEGKRFIKSTTSIKVRTEIFNSKNLSDNSTIPPEALNGLPIGQSISASLQGQILLGKNLSLNTNASYIDNSRYNNFFTISGELRAYF